MSAYGAKADFGKVDMFTKHKAILPDPRSDCPLLWLLLDLIKVISLE
jgi:hypothetical protein